MRFGNLGKENLMKRFFLTFAVLFSFTSTALAQPSLRTRCESALRRALDADASWKMERKLEGSNRTLVSTGLVSCAAQKGIIWDMRFPFAEKIAMTTDRMVFTDEDGRREKTLSELPHYSRMREACDAFLAGDSDAFKAIVDIEISAGEHGGWKAVFKPSNRNMRRIMEEVEMTGDETVERIVMRTKGGGITKIEFKEISRSTHLLWKDE